jgi:hypothetical protein
MTVLMCACCGGEAPGRQWWNRDKGYGVCARCFERTVKAEGLAMAVFRYGRPGVNHSKKKAGP